jgi:hypothetical protein
MNQFLQSAKQAINLHGSACTYTQVTTGEYNVETGSVTTTEVSTAVKAYKKHIRATQFSYPNLIGKDAVLIYLVADSIVGFPAANDKITFGTETYQVDQWQSHTALGQVVLYRISAVKA